MGVYLLRCVELGREQQARLGKQRRDLAAVIAAAWPAATIATSPGRLVVELAGDAIGDALAALPGVSSVSPCVRVATAAIVDAAVEVARAAGLTSAQSFAVRVRRDRRAEGLGSLALARAVADAVGGETGARVDLTHPEVAIGIEVRGDVAYVFDRILAGVDRTGPMRPAAAGEPRFVADQMLGRLAARLRLLGFDTLTVFDIADSEVTRLAAKDGRVLLTRDAPLSRTLAVPVYFVQATNAQQQLAEVIAALGIVPDRARLFTRCTLCNASIGPAEEAALGDAVPPNVRGKGHAFYRCTGCAQVYWNGSQVERVLADLAGSGVFLGPALAAS